MAQAQKKFLKQTILSLAKSTVQVKLATVNTQSGVATTESHLTDFNDHSGVLTGNAAQFFPTTLNPLIDESTRPEYQDYPIIIPGDNQISTYGSNTGNNLAGVIGFFKVSIPNIQNTSASPVTLTHYVLYQAGLIIGFDALPRNVTVPPLGSVSLDFIAEVGFENKNTI